MRPCPEVRPWRPRPGRAYEDLTGRKMKPVCMEHEEYPWCRASLDGWNAKDGIILEIKCMGDWNHKRIIKSQAVPYYYRPQIHHEMLVCDKAKAVHFWAYTDSLEFAPHLRGVLVVVPRNEEYLKELLEMEMSAYSVIESGQKEMLNENPDERDAATGSGADGPGDAESTGV